LVKYTPLFYENNYKLIGTKLTAVPPPAAKTKLSLVLEVTVMVLIS
jgi:hypothetical protein